MLALLRLDPIWDPLRADPAFQKLCRKAPVNPRDSGYRWIPTGEQSGIAEFDVAN